MAGTKTPKKRKLAARTGPAPRPKAATGTIRQEVALRASAHDLYETLMDQEQHGGFTGGEAVISRKEGGKFSIFDGWATGKNVRLEKDRRIVQSWRTSDWPRGAPDSEVEFELVAQGAEDTLLRFTQRRVPAGLVADLTEGWEQYYWGPLRTLFER